jgi:carbonic anhydrase
MHHASSKIIAAAAHVHPPFTYLMMARCMYLAGLAGEDWLGSDADGTAWICQTGQQQSPVNLPASADAAAPLDASHKASWVLGSLTATGSNVGVANNGHSVQLFWQDAGFEPYVNLVVQGEGGAEVMNVRRC